MPGSGFAQFAVFAVHRPELDVLHLGSAGHSDSRVRPVLGFFLRPVRLDSRSVVPGGPERQFAPPRWRERARPCCTRPGWLVHLALPPSLPPLNHPARLRPTRALSRCNWLIWPDPIIERKGSQEGYIPARNRCGGFGAEVGKTLHRNDPPRMAGRFNHRIYPWRGSKEKHR